MLIPAPPPPAHDSSGRRLCISDLRGFAAGGGLGGDPTIQAIISDELEILRDRLLEVTGLGGQSRETVSAVLMGWLVFVRSLCLDWLADPTCTRTELREVCVGALLGALEPIGHQASQPSSPNASGGLTDRSSSHPLCER